MRIFVLDRLLRLNKWRVRWYHGKRAMDLGRFDTREAADAYILQLGRRSSQEIVDAHKEG